MKKQLAALLCGTMLLTAALSGCTMNSPVEGKTETTTAAKTEGRLQPAERQAVQRQQSRRLRSDFWHRHFRPSSLSTLTMV